MLAGLCLDTTSVNTVQTGAITVVKQAFEKDCSSLRADNDREQNAVILDRAELSEKSKNFFTGNSSSNHTNP